MIKCRRFSKRLWKSMISSFQYMLGISVSFQCLLVKIGVRNKQILKLKPLNRRINKYFNPFLIPLAPKFENNRSYDVYLCHVPWKHQMSIWRKWRWHHDVISRLTTDIDIIFLMCSPPPLSLYCARNSLTAGLRFGFVFIENWPDNF